MHDDVSTSTGRDAVSAMPTERRSLCFRRSRRPSTARRTSPWTIWALRAGSLVVPLVAWHLLTANQVRAWLAFDKLPLPIEVLRALASQATSATFLNDIGMSLQRIGVGFGLATAVGVGVGIATARSSIIDSFIRPAIEVVRPVPAIALVPIAILLFPTNEQGIIAITFAAAFFPIFVSTRHAVRALPVVWEEAVRTLGGSRTAVLRLVILPGALPGIFAGLSVGMGVAWICVISAEMISGEFGVGYRTWQAFTIVDYPGVVAGMFVIAALGLGTSMMIESVGRRFTRWLPRESR